VYYARDMIDIECVLWRVLTVALVLSLTDVCQGCIDKAAAELQCVWCLQC